MYAKQFARTSLTMDAARDGTMASSFVSDNVDAILARICAVEWERANREEILRIAKAYYYVSVQFRENLEIACALYPDDALLQDLRREECATDNLSPWPGIAAPGEQMDHDEFVRRLVGLQPIERAADLDAVGMQYLAFIRSVDKPARAKSIASYENEGLSRVFASILRAPCWEGPGQLAFRHFLERHIEFDTDATAGHGVLSRHLVPDDGILPLWRAFERILAAAVPRLAGAEHRRDRDLSDGVRRRLGPNIEWAIGVGS